MDDSTNGCDGRCILLFAELFLIDWQGDEAFG
jgi:hypothetical protein